MAGATVIIVDDDRSFVQAVALFLEKHGYHTRTGFNGREGLDLLRENADVAVIDVHMPDISGLELADEAQSLTNGPAIILISSDDSPETAERCRKTGAARFMAKPLAPRELLEAIGQGARERS